MVGGTCPALACVLLRSLWICEHHGARNSNVYPLSYRDSCSWSPLIRGGVIPRLFFQSERLADALRHNASSNLFRSRVYNAAAVVVDWTDSVTGQYSDLGHLRLHVVETVETLVVDRDEMVVKSMSWALRELAKREPKLVRAFLSTHKGALAARVTREVDNKLTTGLKNARKEKR